MGRKVIAIAAFLGAIGIILGAFGAHGLKKIVSEAQVGTFEIGVRYQIYHALFLLFVGGASIFSEKVKKTILVLTLLGVLFFSGSIYLLTFKDSFSFNVGVIGPITPVGGVLLIISWVIAGIQAWKSTALKK